MYVCNAPVRNVGYDNNLDAFIPEQWALESIALLIENMRAPLTVHRDFEPVFAKFGDTVNTRKPRDFDARRKHKGDNVVTQDAIADNVAVVLNQHVHTSFIVDDGDETMAMTSLVDTYIRPAAISLARYLDRIVLFQAYQMLENQAGTFGGLSTSNAAEYMVGAREVLERNLAPEDPRYLALGTASEAKVLQNSLFIKADERGDTSGLNEAFIGRKFGFGVWKGQNVPSLVGANGLGAGAVNEANGYAAGTTVLTVDAFGASEVVPGDWISIGGKIYHVTATDNATATEITLEYGLVAAVANDAVITVYPRAAVNLLAGYAAGYAKEILIDTIAIAGTVKRGQLLTFGTQNVRYGIVRTDGTSYVELDRPLESAIADGDVVHLGPLGGDINLAYHRNFMTLAMRPFKAPRPGAGAVAATVNFNGVGMRVTIAYDSDRQGHKVTLDFLAGVKILDENLAAPMLG